MQRKPVDAGLAQDLSLGGNQRPLRREQTSPWDITFECLTDNSGSLYTCYFRRELANVSSRYVSSLAARCR